MTPFKQYLAKRRLRKLLDPDYRENRLRQFTPERRARYWRNVEMFNED